MFLVSTLLSGVGALFVTTGSAVITLAGMALVLAVVLGTLLRRNADDGREDSGVDVPADELSSLVRDQYPRLKAYLTVLGFSRDVAEDAAKEALIEYIAVRETVRSPKAWLRRTSFNMASALAGKVPEEPLDSLDFVGVPDGTAGVDLKLTLHAVARTLPTKQRKVLALSLMGLSISEIAADLKCTEETVRSNLRHARKKLHHAFEEEER